MPHTRPAPRRQPQGPLKPSTLDDLLDSTDERRRGGVVDTLLRRAASQDTSRAQSPAAPPATTPRQRLQHHSTQRAQKPAILAADNPRFPQRQRQQGTSPRRAAAPTRRTGSAPARTQQQHQTPAASGGHAPPPPPPAGLEAPGTEVVKSGSIQHLCNEIERLQDALDTREKECVAALQKYDDLLGARLEAFNGGGGVLGAMDEVWALQAMVQRQTDDAESAREELTEASRELEKLRAANIDVSQQLAQARADINSLHSSTSLSIEKLSAELREAREKSSAANAAYAELVTTRMLEAEEESERGGGAPPAGVRSVGTATDPPLDPEPLGGSGGSGGGDFFSNAVRSASHRHSDTPSARWGGGQPHQQQQQPSPSIGPSEMAGFLEAYRSDLDGQLLELRQRLVAHHIEGQVRLKSDTEDRLAELTRSVEDQLAYLHHAATLQEQYGRHCASVDDLEAAITEVAACVDEKEETLRQLKVRNGLLAHQVNMQHAGPEGSVRRAAAAVAAASCHRRMPSEEGSGSTSPQTTARPGARLGEAAPAGFAAGGFSAGGGESQSCDMSVATREGSEGGAWGFTQLQGEMTSLLSSLRRGGRGVPQQQQQQQQAEVCGGGVALHHGGDLPFVHHRSSEGAYPSFRDAASHSLSQAPTSASSLPQTILGIRESLRHRHSGGEQHFLQHRSTEVLSQAEVHCGEHSFVLRDDSFRRDASNSALTYTNSLIV